MPLACSCAAYKEIPSQTNSLRVDWSSKKYYSRSHCVHTPYRSILVLGASPVSLFGPVFVICAIRIQSHAEICLIATNEEKRKAANLVCGAVHSGYLCPSTSLVNQSPICCSCGCCFFSPFAIVCAADNRPCYYPDGTKALDHTPCSDDANTTCCSSDHICMANGYCMNAGSHQPYGFSRAACTSQNWGTGCPQRCVSSEYRNRLLCQC